MSKKEVTTTHQIQITVGLNEERRPVTLTWQADDDPGGGQQQECKAMLLSLFDLETKDTLKIDLWTEEMQVLEMDRFFYQTLRSLADTYFKATQNRDLGADMHRFAQYFGEQTGAIPQQQ